MKIVTVCFIFTLLAGRSISVQIKSAEQSDVVTDVAEAAIDDYEDTISANKSTEEEPEFEVSPYSVSTPSYPGPSYSPPSYSTPAKEYLSYSNGYSAFGEYRPASIHLDSYSSPSYSRPSYSAPVYSTPAKEYLSYSAQSKGYSVPSYGGYRPAGIHVPSYHHHYHHSYSAPSYSTPSYTVPAPVYGQLPYTYPSLDRVRCGSNLRIGCQPHVGTAPFGSYYSSYSVPSYSASVYSPPYSARKRSMNILDFGK